MDTKKQKQLSTLLKEYFSYFDINKRDFLAKNEVARLLKDKLSAFGRWKNLPRGRPNQNIR